MNISKKVDVLAILKVGVLVLAGILLMVVTVKDCRVNKRKGREVISVQFVKNGIIQGEVVYDLAEGTEEVKFTNFYNEGVGFPADLAEIGSLDWKVQVTVKNPLEETWYRRTISTNSDVMHHSWLPANGSENTVIFPVTPIATTTTGLYSELRVSSSSHRPLLNTSKVQDLVHFHFSQVCK